jgi:DNA repair exonuclease SbcCD ATPase subunit
MAKAGAGSGQRTASKGKGAGGGEDPSHDIDGLFKLPLAEFTAARNAVAARLKKAGRTPDAEAVKALPKPSVAAWVVNQLYWRQRKEFDHLIDTGERFRKAQATHLAGKSADIRGPLDARRQALSALVHMAADTLKSGGYSATPDMMRRVTSTLEALSTYGALPDAPPAGRLVDDVEPPGFETLAALVPRIGKARRDDEAPTRVLTFRQQARAAKATRRKLDPAEEARLQEEERKAQAASARAAVQEAERTLRDARKSAEQAEAALKKAATRAKDVERERAEAEKRFEKAAADAEASRQQARQIAAEAEEAAQAVEDAERGLEKARRQLDQFAERT